MTIEVILGVTAGLMHVVAFYRYNKQAVLGISCPRKATWLLWVFISSSNCVSYFIMGEHWPLAILPTVSTIACILVFFRCLFRGNFSKLDFWDDIALVLGIIALLVWWRYRFTRTGAIYANLILQPSIAISFIPTYRGLWKNPENEQNPLPWFIFSAAYIFHLIAVFLEWKGAYMLFYPINCFLLHFVVGIWSLRKPKGGF